MISQRIAHPRSKENTSDHTYQGIEAQLLDSKNKVLCSIQGNTWNLMNFAISKINNTEYFGKPYKNNPWDFTESIDEYFARKQMQMDKILDLIIKDEKLDFFFLQEVDIFTVPTTLYQIGMHQAPPVDREEIKTRYEEMNRVFTKALQDLHWGILKTTKPQPGQSVTPLVTLYCEERLKPAQQVSVFDGVGFSCEFIHKKSNRKVNLVNLHLKYEGIYGVLLPEYQMNEVNANHFTIMGGDTNHVPNQNNLKPGTDIPGLINNWNNATNLAGVEKDNNLYIVDTHDESGKYKKCYDCFLVNPDSHDTRVKIIERPAEVFIRPPGQDQFVVEAHDPALIGHHVHLSALGKPWIRDGFKQEQSKLHIEVSTASFATLYQSFDPRISSDVLKHDMNDTLDFNQPDNKSELKAQIVDLNADVYLRDVNEILSFNQPLDKKPELTALIVEFIKDAKDVSELSAIADAVKQQKTYLRMRQDYFRKGQDGDTASWLKVIDVLKLKVDELKISYQDERAKSICELLGVEVLAAKPKF